MEEAFLPEEIIVLILTFLPVKSLIRFTCVSKRFYFVILCDPKFAQSQLKAASELKTLTHRLLFYTLNNYKEKLCRLKSLDLDTPTVFGDESSVRKLTFPFDIPALEEEWWCYGVNLLGSSNGIVFLALHHRIVYMWNPSINNFKRLPEVLMPPHQNFIVHYGVGYLPATDDYRVFICSIDLEEMENRRRDTIFVFSTRVKAWKKYQVNTPSYFQNAKGTSLNEALHWVDQDGRIVVFDLGDEEGKFREMSFPNFDNEDGNVRYDFSLGVSAQGCLSLTRYRQNLILNLGCHIDVWVMNEYDVCSSWTKLFNLTFSDYPKVYVSPSSAFLIGTSMVAELRTKRRKYWIIRTDHKDGKHGKYKLDGFELDMIQIQETLIWIYD